MSNSICIGCQSRRVIFGAIFGALLFTVMFYQTSRQSDVTKPSKVQSPVEKSAVKDFKNQRMVERNSTKDINIQSPVEKFTVKDFKDQRPVENNSTKNIKIQSPVEKDVMKFENITHGSRNISETDKHRNKTYLLTYYETFFVIRNRPEYDVRSFSTCRYSNCRLSMDKADLAKSDAVIWKGRDTPAKPGFTRPRGQVWIFAEDESPVWDFFGGYHYRNDIFKSAFNWTMTYDKSNTDFYFPYGELRNNDRVLRRDYLGLAKNKTKDALIITSHCDTHSKREKYINELKKYISVDVFGDCGKHFTCGKAFIHDNCFDILNTTYRYYLAFENAFCRAYRTEKFFENYKYDILMLTRGDMTFFNNDPTEKKDAYISTSNFKTIKELGEYLQSVSKSPEKYAELLKKKDKYISVPYQDLYQRALCEICEHMNEQDKYHKEINDINEWRNGNDQCYDPKDFV